MTMQKIPLKGGAEFDALTSARRFHIWPRGWLKKIKRGYNKRLRKHFKTEFKRNETE